MKISSTVHELSLLNIGQSPKGGKGKDRKNKQWDLQTYAEYASKAERSNPKVSVTKELMDDAFRMTAMKLARGGKSSGTNWSHGHDRMMRRVSGRSVSLICYG